MNREKLSSLIKDSPSVRLVCAHNAVLILSFFYKEFKSTNTIRRSNAELVRKLADELEDWNEESKEDAKEFTGDTTLQAKKYLEQWTEKGYLLKVPDETGEHWHELTTDTIKTLEWLEMLLSRQRFVGADSRFKDIFRKIKMLITDSSEDPEQKINELETQKKELERQIALIRETGKVNPLDNTQVEEQFTEVNKMAKALLADFREVEENFKRIARDIYEKQSAQAYTKGGLLGIALDAYEELRQKDQGKSFYAFWEFLQSDASKEEFKGMIEQLYNLLKDRRIEYGNDQFLRHLKRYLHEYGKRVLESNDKLGEKLNRLLAEKALAERKKALELIRDIRTLALQTVNNPPADHPFIEPEVFEAAVDLPLARGLNYGQDDYVIRRQPGTEERATDLPDLSILYQQFTLNRKKLEENVRKLLLERSSLTLREVTEHYPVEKGLSEVLTYFSIASRYPQSYIDKQEEEVIIVNEKQVRIPKLYFKR